MVDNTLLKIIEELEDIDCNFIINTEEYKDLDYLFKSFFGDSFNYDKLIKLNKKCYIFDNYIIKFKDFIPSEVIIYTDELAKTYVKGNFIFKNTNRVLYLGIEIQDYITGNENVNIKDLESVWLSLYRRGYMWADAKLNNILKKDDKVYIVDTDYIYKNNLYDLSNESYYSKLFREKYKDK